MKDEDESEEQRKPVESKTPLKDAIRLIPSCWVLPTCRHGRDRDFYCVLCEQFKKP